ncbi:solute carrier family 22 member 20-like [Lissotriton helveticus]
MTFNDLLESVGGVGPFQILHTFFLLLPVCLAACHNFLQNFSAVIPSHHCKIPTNTSWADRTNLTYDLSKSAVLVPFIPVDGNRNPDNCRHFASAQWRLLESNFTVDNMTHWSTVPCTEGWTYDQTVFSSTIVTEWDLVCEHRQMRQVAQTIYMAGVMVGAIVFGSASDRYGRRAVLIWSYLQMGVTGTCVAFLPSFGCYCAFRFLSGTAVSGILLNTLSLLLEWMPTKGRTVAGTLMGYSFTFGQMALAGVAYGIRDWRWLQFAVSAPYFIFFLFSWLLPESARWLILHGKPKTGLRNLQTVAWINRRMSARSILTVEMVKSHMHTEIMAMRSSHSLVDLIRTPAVRRISCLLAMLWFSMSFAYYGLAMDLQKFGYSIFLVQACFGAIDIPAKLVGAATMSMVGRRCTETVSLTLAGLMIIANLFVPQGMKSVRTVLSALGKGCLASAFTCAYLYSGELYPTEIRQTGMGFVSMCARIGAMVAPLVLMVSEYASFVPPLIYGLAAVLAACGVCFLTETLNQQLPDTIDAVENSYNLRKKQKVYLEKSLNDEDIALTEKEGYDMKNSLLDTM